MPPVSLKKNAHKINSTIGTRQPAVAHPASGANKLPLAKI